MPDQDPALQTEPIFSDDGSYDDEFVPASPDGETKGEEAAPAAEGKTGVNGSETDRRTPADKSYLDKVPDERFDQVVYERNDLRQTVSQVMAVNQQLADQVKELLANQTGAVTKSEVEDDDENHLTLPDGSKIELMSDGEKALARLIKEQAKQVEQATSRFQQTDEQAAIDAAVATFDTTYDSLIAEAGITASEEDKTAVLQAAAKVPTDDIAYATRLAFRDVMWGKADPAKPTAKPSAAEQAQRAKDRLVTTGTDKRPTPGAKAVSDGRTGGSLRDAATRAYDRLNH